MAHLTARESYGNLIKRLNKSPQGAPESELLYKILKILFSEKEAELVSKLSIRPFTAKKASLIWKMDLTSTRKILDDLAGRAILVDINLNGETEYALPPPMAGFFEFSLMRVRNDIDQKVLSELFYQYLNVEEDFVKDLFTRGETQLGRVFVQERVLTNDMAVHVLDFEKATEIIKSSPEIGISMCYCRHKMKHMDRACDAPMDICMTFNTSGSSLIRHGHARKVDEKECIDLLHKAWDFNLVQFGENNREGVNFICNCCQCCCEALLAAQKFASDKPIHTTNYIIAVNSKECNGCGKCVKVCPIDALKLVPLNDSQKSKNGKSKKTVVLNEELCLGCGVCVKNCSSDSLFLIPRSKRVITPLNMTHRTVIMAIERGNLLDVLSNSELMWNHRLLASFIGAVLKIPFVKKNAVLKQLNSRYLEKIMRRFSY